ncbi:hypothetical protein QUB68_15070 [Microcoleus sp. A006_D1]
MILRNECPEAPVILFITAISSLIFALSFCYRSFAVPAASPAVNTSLQNDPHLEKSGNIY